MDTSEKQKYSRSQNGGQNRRLGCLTLSVAWEPLNAARAASTDRVILPSVLFPRVFLFLSEYLYSNNFSLFP